MSGLPSLMPITALDGEALRGGFWPQRWWQTMDFKVGIVPFPEWTPSWPRLSQSASG
jgi:hypothetical protein